MSVDLERQLIGALLNAPEAASAALAAKPEFFEDEYLGAIKHRMDAEDGFTLATIVADMETHPMFEVRGGRGYLADLYTGVSKFDAKPKLLAPRLVDAYKRRQALRLIDYQHSAIQRGADVDAIVAEYKPQFEALVSIGGGSSRFRPVAISDVTVPPQQWRIKGIMPANGVGFVAGASGAGKSFLTIDIGMRLASGVGQVLNRPAKKCGVVYVAAEDFLGCHGRVKAWQIENGIGNDVPFELVGGSVNLMDKACVEDLCKALCDSASRFADRGVRLGLVVVDTLARCLPGVDENSSEGGSLAIGALEAMAVCSGAFVLAVAHHGKSGTQGGIRGWSGFNAASDMTLTVERSDEDKTLRSLTLSKIKNGIDGEVFNFRLRSVGLGVFDEDGDEVESCVCAFEDPTETAEPARLKSLSPPAEIALKAVRYAHDYHDAHPVPAGCHGQTWSRAIKLDAVRTVALRNGFAPERTEEGTNLRFEKAVEQLVAANRVRTDMGSGLVWLI